jgi:hypothetical protein
MSAKPADASAPPPGADTRSTCPSMSAFGQQRTLSQLQKKSPGSAGASSLGESLRSVPRNHRAAAPVEAPDELGTDRLHSQMLVLGQTRHICHRKSRSGAGTKNAC